MDVAKMFVFGTPKLVDISRIVDFPVTFKVYI